MYIYRGHGFDGVTIVGFGLSLNVAYGKATVEYNGETGDYYEVLKLGHIPTREATLDLDRDQLAWLEDNKRWVKNQLAEE